MTVETERRFVRVPAGMLHCAISGEGDAVLLLHQTPRSWLEYEDVLPLLGRRRRAIALDTVGFGDSARLPPGENSIERWAEVAVSLLDALDIRRVSVVGHHTGAYVATEIAAAYPTRVTGAVLSSLSFEPEEERLRQTSGRAAVDDVDPMLDGEHLVELWRKRAAFYPRDVMLLERYLVDCLKAGPLAAEGHRVAARYRLEKRLTAVACPVLLLAATHDPHAYPSLPRLRALLPDAAITEIEGGMVPLPDQLPQAFATAVEAFLDTVEG